MGEFVQLTTLFQQIINGLSLGSVYALIAVGYSLVYSILLFSNFAHGGFLVVGGYACYFLLTQRGFSIWIAMAGAIVASGIVAVLTERLTYKPIRERNLTPFHRLFWTLMVAVLITVLTSARTLAYGARILEHLGYSPASLAYFETICFISVVAFWGVAIAVVVAAVGWVARHLGYKRVDEASPTTLYLLIGSMGVSIVIENIFVIVVGGRFRALPASTFPTALFNLGGGVTVSSFDILSFFVAILFLGGLQVFLTRTRWGLAIRAAAFDLRTAGLMGVNVALLISIVFFVAGLLAAVGGVFLSVRYTLYPQLGSITTKAFVAAVIGGLGSLPGAVVGSLLLGLAEMLTAGFISSQMRDLVVFSMLVIMLLVKPAGFFGKQISDKI